MSIEDKKLSDWAKKADSELPTICPNCNTELKQIRYGYDCTRQVIHLTGVTNEYNYFVAECPLCKHVLKKESDGKTQSHWK